VILLHVLPVALLAPAWSAGPRAASWRGYYAGLAGALALGAALASGWVLAATRAEPAFSGRAVLMDQTLDRVLASRDHVHAAPWWTYLALLPLMALPWTPWPRVWAAGRRLARGPRDDGVRLCVVWAVCGLALASIIPAKQPHYLLPLLPPLALLAARALAALPQGERRRDAAGPALVPLVAGGALVAVATGRLPDAPLLPAGLPAWPGAALLLLGLALAAAPAASAPAVARRLTLASGALVLVALFGVLPALLPPLDVRPAARLIAGWQQAGRPVASVDKVRGDYDFAGRLREPVVFLEPFEVESWAQAHPDGVLLTTDEAPREGDVTPLATMNGGLRAWDARTLPKRLRTRHLR
jgi:4-amino-4-deoxy-L-arabinose transferase-like glycosyltransferase